MSIYLSHTSLRKAWALIGHKGLTANTLCNVRRPLDAARTLHEIKRAAYFESGFLSHIAPPFDLLFPSKESRIRSKLINPHLCLRDLPEGSFRRLRPDLYVLTPAMNFIQMGEILSVPRLAAYGLELCGTYALAPKTKRGFVDRSQLVTFDDLLEATHVGPNLRGVKKARIALEWVRENSRSPRETILTLVLCFSGTRGGYGLPLPDLNKTVTLSPSAARIAGVPVLHPDLCWENKRTLVEYDSDGIHLEEGQVIRDVDRKDAFVRDGWRVITITKARLGRPEVLDRIVREELGPLLGVQIPPACSEFLAKRRELRSDLFGFDPYVSIRPTGRGRIVMP